MSFSRCFQNIYTKIKINMQGGKLLENSRQNNPTQTRTPFQLGLAGLKDSYFEEEKKCYVVAALHIKRQGRIPSQLEPTKAVTILQRGNPSEVNSITHAFVGVVNVLQDYKATKIDEKDDDESMEEPLKNGGTTEVPMKEKPSDATLKIAMVDATATKMQGESKPSKGGGTIWVPKERPRPSKHPSVTKKNFALILVTCCLLILMIQVP